MTVICALLLAALACSGRRKLSEPVSPAVTALPRQTAILPQLVLPTQMGIPVQTDQSVAAEGVDRTYCDNPEKIHPVGESIARNYQLQYADVLVIYCDGYSFDEILLALETEAQSGTAARELLLRRDAGESWDEIWFELGLIE
jgi:hypothetical protein